MRLLLSLFLFLSAFNIRAENIQKPAQKSPLAIHVDQSQPDVRQFNEQAVNEYKNQQEFKYETEPVSSNNWWTRFWRWFWSLFSKSNFKGGAIIGEILKYLLYVIGISTIVFITIKLIGLDFKLLTRKSKAIEVPFEETLENIHEINFDEQITKALNDGNYRLAVRLLYLKTLKCLSDQHHIIWMPEKTNQHYISEIQNEAQRQAFTALTYQFEHVWYGDFSIEKTNFESIHQSFHQFNQIAK